MIGEIAVFVIVFMYLQAVRSDEVFAKKCINAFYFLLAEYNQLILMGRNLWHY